jgi:NAD(P)-dependent dehydrogenase (short-subunit alcohol dehydrogenase family)
MTTYLITGVNRGIGAALAAGATARGHTVIGTTRDGQDGTVPLTLDDPARIAAQLADIPQVDVLINNAGVIGPDPDQQTPLNMDWGGFTHTLASTRWPR